MSRYPRRARACTVHRFPKKAGNHTMLAMKSKSPVHYNTETACQFGDFAGDGVEEVRKQKEMETGAAGFWLRAAEGHL